MGLQIDLHSRDFRGWILLAVLVLVLAAAGDVGREWLRFEREAIGDGQWWRLVSGHLVHLSLTHTALNLAGLMIIAVLFGDTQRLSEWLLLGLASMIAINLGLWFQAPGLQWYVGLSGVLHGLLAGAILAGLKTRRVESIVLGVLLIAKLVWEQFSGPIAGSETLAQGAVVVDAHLYGAVGGLLASVILYGLRRVRGL